MFDRRPYHIWVERNLRVFQYKAIDSGGIALKIVDAIPTRMSSRSLVNENPLNKLMCSVWRISS